MGRLIDTSNIRVKPQDMQDVMGIAMIRCEDLSRILADVPTVEAIPKADYDKLVNDNKQLRAYITMMQADYKYRLKDDMVAMLTDIQLDIEEKFNDRPFSYNHHQRTEFYRDIDDIIQQKIDKLEGSADV